MAIISNFTKKLLELSFLRNIGPKALYRFASEPTIEFMTLKEIVQINNKTQYVSDVDVIDAESKAAEQIEIADISNHRIISIADDFFPKTLRETSDCPAIIYVAGSLNSFSEKSLCVIGTREPTKHGEVIARKITNWFAERNWTIVSGLAIGIDTLAHMAALHSKAPTVAVMAHGLDKVYPRKNKDLAEEILRSGGALVSEYRYGVEAFKGNFVKRDRIQAGLSSAVCLIQTGVKGGSLHASRAILEYGRFLLVAEQSKTDRYELSEKALGNINLIDGDLSAAKKMLSIDSFKEKQLYKLLGNQYLESAENLILNSREVIAPAKLL